MSFSTGSCVSEDSILCTHTHTHTHKTHTHTHTCTENFGVKIFSEALTATKFKNMKMFSIDNY